MSMRILIATLVAAAIAAPACDKDGSSPSAPTPQTLEGTWRATKAEFVSVASSGRRVELVAQGATVTLAFTGNNYTFTISQSGQAPVVQTGTWSASSEVMTLTRAGYSGNQQFDMTFSANSLTLNGANALFDFNTGVFEEAKLYMTLARQ
jgi:hypothetical protein